MTKSKGKENVVEGASNIDDQELAQTLSVLSALHIRFLEQWAREQPAEVAGVNMLAACNYDIIQAINREVLAEVVESNKEVDGKKGEVKDA